MWQYEIAIGIEYAREELAELFPAIEIAQPGGCTVVPWVMGDARISDTCAVSFLELPGFHFGIQWMPGDDGERVRAKLLWAAMCLDQGFRNYVADMTVTGMAGGLRPRGRRLKLGRPRHISKTVNFEPRTGD